MCTLSAKSYFLSLDGILLPLRFTFSPRRKVRNLCRTPQPDRVINGRSPDLRVFACLGLPVIKQWRYPASLSAYSCGGSRRIGCRRTAFPFNSLTRLCSRDHQSISIISIKKIKTKSGIPSLPNKSHNLLGKLKLYFL